MKNLSSIEMTATNHALNFTLYMNSLEPPENFSSEDWTRAHPYATVIHRRAESKDMIGTAWGGREYNKRYSENRTRCFISMNDPNKDVGISCTSFCCYRPEIVAGKIPLTEDLFALGFTVLEEQNLVIIQEMEFPLYRCYNRSVEQVDSMTVGQARDARGKDPQLCFDPNGYFSLYFNNKESCYVCLVDEVEQLQGTIIAFLIAISGSSFQGQSSAKIVGRSVL